MKKLIKVGTLLGAIFVMVGCGSGGGGTTTSTTADLPVSVSEAVSADFSALPAGLKLKGVTEKGPAEAVVARVDVEAQNAAGEVVGTGCTTNATGTCEITGLTEAELQAGLVIVAGKNAVPIHAYREYTSTETAAAIAGTTDLVTVPVNTEEDLAFATLKDACGGTLGNCPETVDRNCIQEATTALMGDNTPSTSNLNGYAEAALAFMAVARTNATVGGTTPADLAKEAIGGNPTNFTALSGTTTSTGSVPVGTAFENFKLMMNKVKTAYCDKAAAGDDSTWKSTRTSALAADQIFDSGSYGQSLTGFFGTFQPLELAQYETEDIRGFATNLPNVAGGFQMFNNEKARQALSGQFRKGGFADPTKAGAALGFITATFPAPTTAGDYSVINFDAYDPDRAVDAAHNTWLQYTGATSTYSNPQDFFDKFGSTLRNPIHQQAIVGGGSSAIGDFVDGFVSNGANFDPNAYIGGIKAPTNGSCTDNTDCLPCDTCSNSICVSNSQKMGASCTSNSNCDDITTCVGGQNIDFSGGYCMCGAGVPTGAFVYQTAGAGPASFGTDFFATAAGQPGGICNSTTSCSGGATCTDAVNGGVCLDPNFKKGPYAPCSTAAECDSGTCSSGACAPGSGGTKSAGQSCGAGSECASWFCCLHSGCGDALGTCSNPPTEFGDAFAVLTGGKVADGGACTTNDECGSFFCKSGVCAPFVAGSTKITGQANGSPCFDGTQCISGFCFYSPGVGGTCQAN